MTYKNLIASVAALGMVVAPVAASAGQAAGKIVSGNGALIVRDGKVVSASAGDSLRAGDRVVSRAGQSVKVASSNCATTLSGASSVAIASDGCSNVVSLAANRAGANVNAANAFQGGEGGGSTGGLLIGGLAALAIGAGIYFAVDGDEKPVSP